MDLEQSRSESTTQATKQCWSCTETIPYNLGFCANCWSRLSVEDAEIYNLSFTCTPSVGGAIRLAVARHIEGLRRPKREAYVPRAKVARAKLPPINLSLEDLEL